MQCMQAAAKAAAAAEAAAAEVSSGAGGLPGSGGRLLEVSPDLLQQDGPVTRRMFHMQQDQQLGSRLQKGTASLGAFPAEAHDGSEGLVIACQYFCVRGRKGVSWCSAKRKPVNLQE